MRLGTRLRFAAFLGSLRRTRVKLTVNRVVVQWWCSGGAVVAQFESSHVTILTEAWKPASLKAMPLQSNTM
jgi:hypothetical protein